MLSIAGDLTIFAYLPPTDMRLGVNGLSGLVRSQLQGDPTDGSLFLFMNRRRDRMKLLYFETGGFWLFYRLLESGTFEELARGDDSCRVQLDTTQLAMLLSGVSLIAAQKRRKRYAVPTA